jgi:3-isopropylmalate/(R)-2-methylmalate dehydratase small subunit
VVLRERNIDTDQIIPARFLTTTQRQGLGQFAFNDWRRLADGSLNPDFAFNRAENAGAAILVAGRNFGCGSSREHAPWALADLGPARGDQQRDRRNLPSNALKNGLLPVVLEDTVVGELLARPGNELHIDVATRRVRLPDGRMFEFPLDAFAQTCLLEAWTSLATCSGRAPRSRASKCSASTHNRNPTWSSSMHADIVVLPGDGIGPEVTAAAVEVLRAVAARYGHHYASRITPSAALPSTHRRNRCRRQTLAAAQRPMRCCSAPSGGRSGPTRRRRCGPNRACWRSARRWACTPTCAGEAASGRARRLADQAAPSARAST